MNCPLCNYDQSSLFHQDRQRAYLYCFRCALVFVPDYQRLDPEAEKAVYDLHQNAPDDQAYRTFLERIFKPLCDRIKPPAQGLDFGSGPGPTLSVMFEEAGYSMSIFDQFYANKPEVFSHHYDFICCTEVIEHIHAPGKIIELLLNLLKPNGWLGIMTKLVIDQQAFSHWHYKEDLTHVCFFSQDTFHWLARHHGCRLEFEGKDVILIGKG